MRPEATAGGAIPRGLAVVGVGLIGGSLAWPGRAGRRREVVGVVRREETIAERSRSAPSTGATDPWRKGWPGRMWSSSSQRRSA